MSYINDAQSNSKGYTAEEIAFYTQEARRLRSEFMAQCFKKMTKIVTSNLSALAKSCVSPMNNFLMGKLVK